METFYLCTLSIVCLQLFPACAIIKIQNKGNGDHYVRNTVQRFEKANLGTRI